MVDIHTLLILAAALYLILPLNLWLALSKVRNTAVNLWCLGSLLAGIGILLIGFRGIIPDWISFPIGNFAIVVSFVMRIKSLQNDYFITKNNHYIILFLIIFLIIYLPLFILNNEYFLGIWARLCMFAACTWMVALLTIIVFNTHSRNAAAILLAYGFLSLSLFTLLFYTILGKSSIYTPLVGYDMLLIFLFSTISSVLGHFGYMGLALERFTINQSLISTTNAKIEASSLRNRELATLDRRQRLGEISSSINHELSQPLTAIMITVQLLERTLKSNLASKETLSNYIDLILVNLKRSNGIIEEIREFFRRSTSDHTDFDVSNSIHLVLRLLKQDLLRENILVSLNLPKHSLIINGNSTFLSQVLLHIIRNSIEAMDNQNSPKIIISVKDDIHSILIIIEDNGTGLNEDTLKNISTPFYTNRPGHLGFGLSISKQILSSLGASLSIENLSPNGARVVIYHPKK